MSLHTENFGEFLGELEVDDDGLVIIEYEQLSEAAQELMTYTDLLHDTLSGMLQMQTPEPTRESIVQWAQEMVGAVTSVLDGGAAGPEIGSRSNTEPFDRDEIVGSGFASDMITPEMVEASRQREAARDAAEREAFESGRGRNFQAGDRE